MAGLYPMEVEEANWYLVQWEHKLGPVNRPFHMEAFSLEIQGRIIAVAVSASTISKIAGGYQRQELVELARLASCERWANRLMLRLWREACAPRWACWSVKAAISYHHNELHNGDLYRFDGWEKIREDCGSLGGGTWSRKRYGSDVVHGKKTLWLWRYEQ
jgi:hypothetical protein